MGSKYKLVPQLAAVFGEIGGTTAIDPFSGSGVVSYLMKSLGYNTVASDFLSFPTVIASATVANRRSRLTPADIERICGPAADDRDFIASTFDGLYFERSDHEFLDSAWSHIDTMSGFKRNIALSALVLAAAKKQPRGVFTFTDGRYNDGRRDLRLTLREHFVETAAAYNAVVFDNGTVCSTIRSDVHELEPGIPDLVYLDPPYTPARDDNCYIKRYHFLEGLSVYWNGAEIMQETKTKKLAKRFTPFSYKRTVNDALSRMFEDFQHSTIVLSYSSNAVPDADTIAGLMSEVKSNVEVREVPHRYHFGTHKKAKRRETTEYFFIGS